MAIYFSKTKFKDDVLKKELKESYSEFMINYSRMENESNLKRIADGIEENNELLEDFSNNLSSSIEELNGNIENLSYNLNYNVESLSSLIDNLNELSNSLPYFDATKDNYSSGGYLIKDSDDDEYKLVNIDKIY